MPRRLHSLIAWCCLTPALAAAPPAWRGLELETAIARLAADGLSVLYSSDLVRPGMVVLAEPVAAQPRAVLAEIVAPHGLAVSPGPNGAVLLVRAATGPDGRIVGRLRRREGDAPVAGAAIRLGDTGPTAVTDATGRFAFTALPPGRYPLRLADTRLALAEEYVARVTRGRTTSIRLIAIGDTPAAPDEIVVSTSQYRLGDAPAPSFTALAATDIEVVPGLGEDALRAVTRLPGIAAAEVSAKSNMRGGESAETLVRFDGLRLYDPYHLKDFQSVFSAIDPGLVDRMDVSTGGFPARYGARMSGVIDIEPLRPTEQPYRELSVSFFNAALLASGGYAGGDGDWLVSARRSNLDLWFDWLGPEYGSPAFMELHAHLGRRLDEHWSLSGNVLLFDDDIELRDEDEEEIASADYRDAYAWLRVDYARGGVEGSVIAAYSTLDSDRIGLVDQPGVSTGELADSRDFRVGSLQADWSLPLGPRAALGLGADWRESSGHYRYGQEVAFEVLFDTPGAQSEPSVLRDLDLRPGGREYGAWASLRYELRDDLMAEAGLRWERETLTAEHGDHLSPRLALRYDLDDRTQLRASWGRYVQLQAINELQVPDGVTLFQPAQRAEHLIAGVEHRFGGGVGLRVEAYRKDYSRLRPRFENLLHSFVLLPELKPDRIRVAPEGARAEGVELMLRGDPDAPFSWWASYGHARVEDRVDGGDIPRAWDQRDAFGAGLIWRSDGWELSLASTYRDGWPTTAVALEQVGDPSLAAVGPRNAGRLGDYFSLDGRLARHFGFSGGDSLTVFLEVTNITNRRNACCVEYEINDDIGATQLEVQDVEYLSVLPSLGFTWRF